MLISTPRILYDYEFINAGCPVEDYNSVYDPDDTIATYSTNFLITLVCLIFATFILLRKGHESQTKNKYYMATFFIGVGLGFFVAGVAHAVIKTSDDPTYIIYARFTRLPAGLGASALLLLLLKFYGLDRSAAAPWNIVWWSLATIVVLFASITSIVEQLLFINQVFFLAAHLCAALVYFQQMCCNNSRNIVTSSMIKRKDLGIRGFAFVILLGSMLIQMLLAPLCGIGGYKDCFEKCPLPAPTFNHNALFHVLYLIGLIVLGWNELQASPVNHAIKSEKEVDEEDFQED